MGLLDRNKNSEEPTIIENEELPVVETKSEELVKEENSSRWLVPEKFGPLWKYIKDDEVTNVDWDAGQLWIQRANRVREAVSEPNVTNKYMEDFSIRVGMEGKKNFNETDTIVMADTETLRIVCLHPSFALSGITVSIRKSLPKLRFNTRMAIDQGLCEEKVMHLLLNCVLAHINFVYCGEPGKGKTETAKFFSSFIPANNKVITVEDVREWHYKEINPGKSCIEIKVKNHNEYENALSIALRLNPAWIMIAETRGREVRYLLEAWSNGVANMTTLHTNSVTNIPDRIINMLGIEHLKGPIVDQIYNNVGIGILMDEVHIGNGNTKHIMKEVGYFYRVNGENHMALIVEDGVFHEERVPEVLLEEIKRKVGGDPYHCEIAFTNKAVMVEK